MLTDEQRADGWIEHDGPAPRDDIVKIADGLSAKQREAIIEGRITECPYNHPHGTRCPNCARWPYKKGGAEAFLTTARDYLRSKNDV